MQTLANLSNNGKKLEFNQYFFNFFKIMAGFRVQFPVWSKNSGGKKNVRIKKI